MNKIFTIFAAALFLAVSCGKEQETPVVTKVEYPVFYATVESAESLKTTLVPDESSASMSFVVDDEIAIFNGVNGDSENHLPCRYKCTEVKDGVATFVFSPGGKSYEEGITPDKDLTEIVATYPYRSPDTGGYETYGTGTAKIRMVATPSSSSSMFAKQTVPLIAYSTGGSVLSFKQTVGVLELCLKGDETINSIAVTSDQNISGAASVNYSAEYPVISMEDTGKTITFTRDEGGQELNNDDGVKFWVGLPVGTHNLSIVITDSENKTMTVTVPGIEIERKNIYAITTAINFNPDPLTNVTNLSAFGHFANCYVVSKAGNYCFNACKPDGTLVSGTDATWVWAAGDACKDQASLPSTMMTSVSYANGKIYFTIPSNITYSKGGNVVLGVIDGSNNSLYTWNVWLTTSDISDQTVSGITVMDRNLGAAQKFDVANYAATNLLHAKGSYYQWGRKDPFLGQRNSSNDGTGKAFQSNPGQYYVLNTALVNIDSWKAYQSIDASSSAYPVYMAAAAPSGASKWSSITNANPCPYGYRVLNNSEFASLVSTGLSQAVLDGNAGYAQVILGSIINLPRVGRRKGGDGLITNCTTNARYYSDDYGTGSNAYCYLFNSSDWTTTDVAATNPTLNANNACSVRCVKQ